MLRPWCERRGVRPNIGGVDLLMIIAWRRSVVEPSPYKDMSVEVLHLVNDGAKPSSPYRDDRFENSQSGRRTRKLQPLNFETL